MSKVTITKNPKTGAIFTANANLGKDGKQYGYIRVESTEVDMSGAFARVKTRSALKPISQEDFNKASGILVEGHQIVGKIINIDSLTEAPGFSALMVPVSKGSAELRGVLSNGQQIYRKTEFTSNLEAADSVLTYDKVAVAAEIGAE